ncbi:MAG TPA: ABC transporter permease [Nitrospiria bacterium]|nr:ABC transporter permease [Nitrospiria bacterium]
MKWILQETTALTMRSVKRLSRERISMVFGLIQPMLFWLILFGNLFQRTAQIPGFKGPNYITFLTAGVVVMTVLNSGLSGGVDLLFDKESGFLERLLSAPISRNSLIYSRFIFVMAITSVQILVILLVAFLLFGVYPHSGLLGMAFIMLVGLLFGLGLIAISLTLAFAIKGHGNFFALTGFLTLPLIFLSTALVPSQAMPGWMAFLAQFNPMTYATEAVRDLIVGGWLWTDIVKVLAVLLVFDAVSIAFSSRIFRRQVG